MPRLRPPLCCLLLRPSKNPGRIQRITQPHLAQPRLAHSSNSTHHVLNKKPESPRRVHRRGGPVLMLAIGSVKTAGFRRSSKNERCKMIRSSNVSPPQKQEQLRGRLQAFNGLPPEQRERVLQRMETWEHLTPQQQQHARDLYQRMKQLPPERQRTMTAAVRNLRQMPPEQRQQILNSPRFRQMFSPEEREMLTGVTQLPMAAPDGGQE